MQITMTGAAEAPSAATAGGQSIRFDIPPSEGGGRGLNGGEALLLAVAGCYANDLQRRLRQEDMRGAFTIRAEATFAGEPVMCQEISCQIEWDGDGNIDAIIAELDKASAIPNSLRQGIPIHVEVRG